MESQSSSHERARTLIDDDFSQRRDVSSEHKTRRAAAKYTETGARWQGEN